MLIDSRGRLFGRFNLVDLAVVVFLALVVPGGYVAYRVFRIPPPEIVRVTPSLFTPETPLRLRLEGRHFRPYLVAVLGKAGEPLSLNRIVLQATFLLQTPEEVELELPKMDPGTYDIHLFDEATEVAVRTAALVVEPERGATIEVRVRFVMLPAVVPLVREGDRDRWERGDTSLLQPDERATMVAVRATGESARLPPGDVAGVVVEGTVRIPAKARRLGGWEYKSVWLRAGETLIFETDRYRLDGVIERATPLPASAPDGGK